MPPRSLQEGLDALALPDDAKHRISELITDSPPSGKWVIWSDSVLSREISPGQSTETLMLKVQRMGLWGLVYFQTQFLPHYVLLNWAGVGVGQRIHKESSDVDRFKKDKRKYVLMFKGLGIRTVSYVTQKSTSDNQSIDGFRLTTNGDDHYCEVNARHGARMGRAMGEYISDLDATRITAEDISDPAYRKAFERDKAVVEDLKREGFVDHFEINRYRQLTAGIRGK
jgi:hypothetical protein